MRALAAAALVLALAGNASAALPRGGLFVPSKSLGGVRLGMTPGQVKTLWGTQHGVCRGCVDETWFFTYLPFQPRGTGVAPQSRAGGLLERDWDPRRRRRAAGQGLRLIHCGQRGPPPEDEALREGVRGQAVCSVNAGGGAFAAKLGPGGNTLAYSTYVAGATPAAIAVDSAGNAVLAGTATPGFIATEGALRKTPGSATTGFVLKLNATGSAPLFATFLGGSNGDSVTSLAVDSRGNAIVGGSTTSADFPTVNAFQPLLRGQMDGFVAKLDAGGKQLLYSTFLGGSLDDAVSAIAIDGNGNAIEKRGVELAAGGKRGRDDRISDRAAAKALDHEGEA